MVTVFKLGWDTISTMKLTKIFFQFQLVFYLISTVTTRGYYSIISEIWRNLSAGNNLDPWTGNFKSN